MGELHVVFGAGALGNAVARECVARGHSVKVDIIYKAAGQAPKARTLPPFVFAILALFVPIMRELKEMEYQWRMRFDIRSDKFMRAFPSTQVTPHEEAVKETLAWYRSRPA
jgi:nucleoside-diphosphate-sugar epimerase